jgi:queuine tRNA-ribosyltransferase
MPFNLSDPSASFIETQGSVKPYFYFEVLYTSKKSKARVGRIHTPHGIIETPGFVAVGTNATIKALDSVLMEELPIDLMFCNTYHLMLQPGAETIQKMGGLHKFMNRKKPLITDSGGFQVFSLAYGGVASELKSKGTKKTDGSVLKISEEGVLFRSYRDGSKLLLTPEKSVEAQKMLGADIIIPFDELPPYHMGEEALKRSLERTHRWEKRSLDTHLKNPQNQAMYAVIHGGIHPAFRLLSCKTLSALAFDGFAIGGSLGKTREEMETMLEYTIPALDPAKPRHLLGIGDLPSLDMAVPLGLDTFDSAYPTKAARHGMALSPSGPIIVDQGIYKEDPRPLDSTCLCHTCTHYSRAYLHHLSKAKEMTLYTLMTIHNLFFMGKTMEKIRQQILNDEI